MKKFFVSFLLLTLSLTSHPETIKLKNGRSVEGKIVKKTDEYLKVDISGIPITYYFDEIESIDNKIIYIPKNTRSSSSNSYLKTPKDIFQSISPAVVYITTRTMTGEDYLGSGFIVDSEGIVVTNYHVVQSAEEVNVKLKDGTIYPATAVIHYDASQDICILKINAENLPAIPLGDSSSIAIGETIYCIGNPLGLEYSFSDGMLSGMRDFQRLKWLQFTAPISPGNSGGPLINSQGEVIGVVTFQAATGQNLNFALAIDEIKPFISQQPKMIFQEFVEKISQADYYFMEGSRYTLQNDYNQAISCYQKAIEINPNFFLAYNNLGTAYTSLGQHQQAITCIQKAIEIDSNSAEAYTNLGSAYVSSGQHQQSISYYQKAIEINSNFSVAHYSLGTVYAFLGQHQQAITCLQKAIEIAPNFAFAYHSLGATFYLLGQYQEARKNLQKAKKLYRAQGDYQHIQQIEMLLQQFP